MLLGITFAEARGIMNMKKLIFILFLIFVMSAIAENMPSGGGGSGPRYFTEEEVMEEANKIADEKVHDAVRQAEMKKNKNFLLMFAMVFLVVFIVFRRKKKSKLPEDKVYPSYTDKQREVNIQPKQPEHKIEATKSEPINEEMFYKEI